MNDLISREDVLSFLRVWENVKDYGWGEKNIIKAVIAEIEALPSAQSPTTAPTTGDTTGDTISRQAAIDAVCESCNLEGDYHKCDGYPKDSTWCEEVTALRNVPSAQPEDRCGECDAWNQYKNYPRQPEIIHCRECIHAIKDVLFGGLWCKGKAVTNNHYCGYAEQKRGGEEEGDE